MTSITNYHLLGATRWIWTFYGKDIMSATAGYAAPEQAPTAYPSVQSCSTSFTRVSGGVKLCAIEGRTKGADTLSDAAPTVFRVIPTCQGIRETTQKHLGLSSRDLRTSKDSNRMPLSHGTPWQAHCRDNNALLPYLNTVGLHS